MNNPQEVPQIDWRKEFETGDPAIDHEHKEMIERINDFLVMANEQPETELVLDHLGQIYAWISAHFALEEKFMREQHYAGFAAHKDDHERLLDDLRDIMDDVEQSGYAGIGENIKSRMSDWFTNHFKTQDALWHSRSFKNLD